MFNNSLLQNKGLPSPPKKIIKVPSIEPVDRKTANIEAERGETILDSNGELGKYLGKKHSKTSNAGTPAQVKPGSFIFSDKLKLPKEYIATILDKEVNKVSKMTPAELSLKFPTKTYLDTLRDENSDSRAKNTADIMLKKNLQSLQTIFEAQQMVKEDSGIQEGSLMAYGGYLPKAGGGFPYLGNIINNLPKSSIYNPIQFPLGYQNNQENINWLNQTSDKENIFEAFPTFMKFMSDKNNIEYNPKGQLSKSSPLVQQQYQGQNFYKDGKYEETPQGRFARITQFKDYNHGSTAIGKNPSSTYNFFSPILLNESTKQAVIPKNAKVDPYYLSDLQKKGYSVIDDSKIKDKTEEELLIEGYDGRTIYNKSNIPISNRKVDPYAAMFDPSNTRENNDAIQYIRDPRYRKNNTLLEPLPIKSLPIDIKPPSLPINKKLDNEVLPNNLSKSKSTIIRDYVSEEANRRKGELYSRMFDQDRLPFFPSYNQAVPYQRANPISYAPTLAGLHSASEQLNNSNTPDQIKGAVFSDYLSKAQDQLGKIDVQNQANNAQITGQNFTNFTNAVNQNQQTNNQYKQQYDQLVQNQEQARTNRKYSLQDAISEINARKAEKNFNYELINADPTSNYSVTQNNKGLRNYINFDWKEKNRLNQINSEFLQNYDMKKVINDILNGTSTIPVGVQQTIISSIYNKK